MIRLYFWWPRLARCMTYVAGWKRNEQKSDKGSQSCFRRKEREHKIISTSKRRGTTMAAWAKIDQAEKKKNDPEHYDSPTIITASRRDPKIIGKGLRRDPGPDLGAILDPHTYKDRVLKIGGWEVFMLKPGGCVTNCQTQMDTCSSFVCTHYIYFSFAQSFLWWFG